MSVLGNLCEAVEEQDRLASQHEEQVALENMHGGIPSDSTVATESFRQDTPVQGVPQDKIQYPIPVQVKQEEDGSTTFTILTKKQIGDHKINKKKFCVPSDLLLYKTED